ncbi:UDP-N-acetylglucosamine 1-carboxyvinyltransferase [Methanosarcina barkeri str. Wiesmoor]|uniref:UDP-N-acetylglucosamine 1-carboxyvinyltransferase n=2 Tax=Methanosarcina barkeri TaxID=2208 RepID=A0A0E3QHR2_METBA|nr:UDP-N-acetylglucosamine 1-carboxyvinyltransferase [Methanosarcina barkeri]AKB50227.1 UDP-N-acetylglucosamine 1-carboxyvinyltransferase [Methanosarcina barkeri str. Wiesmoor]
MNPEKCEYIVRPSRLQGKVKVSGAKNSALRLLAASLLTDEKIELTNYPANLLDAQIHVGMLEALGKKCVVEDEKITIYEEKAPLKILNWNKRSIRNTLLILGALVSRIGEAKVPLPGGCNLGERKFDLHEMLLRNMGAKVWIEDNMLCAKAENGLKGADIFLPIRSTGATENSMICGSLAEGITRVWNPHIQPEILDLARFLNEMGAKIEIFGQEHIKITGVKKLFGTRHSVIADNIEAVTWLIASVITGGDIEIIDFPFKDVEVTLIHLRQSGAKYYLGDNSLIVRGGTPYPVEISTGPYPEIKSDVQPLFAVYGACAKGSSKIVDLRFPGRYCYTSELAKMGLQYNINGNILEIIGGNPLNGAQVRALDLRAGIALALAGLVAKGETRILDAWQIERGYDNFVEKLISLGGNIRYG